MANFVEKLHFLTSDFFHLIINDIQDELKREHLSQEKIFFMLYFPTAFSKYKMPDGRADPSKLTLQELVQGYKEALNMDDPMEQEEIANLIATNWIMKHVQIYEFFENKLKSINENIEEIKELDLRTSEDLCDLAINRFGFVMTYLFVVLNSVALNQETLNKLRKKALEHKKTMEFQCGLQENGGGIPMPIQRKQTTMTNIKLGSHSPMEIQTTFSPELIRGRTSMGSYRRNGDGRSSFSPVQVNLRMSNSFVLPRSEEDYMKVLKSTHMEGWLEKRNYQNSMTNWKMRWVVLSQGTIYYFKEKYDGEIDKDAPVTGYIPLYLVRSIRSSQHLGNTIIEIDAITRRFHFRCENSTVLSQWLFSFQCAIANNLHNMLTPTIQEKKQRILKIEKWWKKSKIIERLLLSSSIGPVMKIDCQRENFTSDGGLKLAAVIASTIGHRPSMEDAHVIVSNMNKKYRIDTAIPQGFFGVFDGHGGSEASEFSAQEIVENFVNNKQFFQNPRQALIESYLITDTNFTMKAEKEELFSGTTAVTAFIRGNRLFVANCGDSRAVIFRDGRAIPLSTDHKASNEAERKRIEAAGGWVMSHQEINLAQLYRLSPEFIDDMEIPQRVAALVGFITIHRVLGELSVTRAIGDREYKGNLKNEYWENEFSADLVLAEPEIMEAELTPKDEFLILACDGLWDVFSNQDAADFIKVSLDTFANPEKACVDLVNEAIKLGSMDNVSVLVVFFGR